MNAYAEVIGDPIAHSRSPLIHGFWSEALGLNAAYRACRVGPGELAAYFESRRSDASWRGCNLTAPLKEIAIPLLDRLSAGAEAVGAVNCVVPEPGQLVGHNSDVDGVAEALSGAQLNGRAVTVIGAGGAARAAVRHLALCEPSVIRILARQSRQAQALADLVPESTRFETYSFEMAARSMADAEAIVNASPLGMSGEPAMPGPIIDALGAAAKSAVVLDMVYRPLDTLLLRAARMRGLGAVDGLTMLIGQADTAFRLFFVQPPPRHRDAELRQRLCASLVQCPIALVGMPGAGKTTTGQILARRLGLEFVDSDQEIERETGIAISDWFEQHGEAKFRETERKVIAGLIGGEPRVIALGGGSLCDQSTSELVRTHCITVWLEASIPTLIERLQSASPRPLLAGRDLKQELSKLAELREPRFAETDIHVPEKRSSDDCASAIIGALDSQYAKKPYQEGIDAPPIQSMIEAT